MPLKRAFRVQLIGERDAHSAFSHTLEWLYTVLLYARLQMAAS